VRPLVSVDGIAHFCDSINAEYTPAVYGIIAQELIHHFFEQWLIAKHFRWECDWFPFKP
jgi:hypothetical protein